MKTATVLFTATLLAASAITANAAAIQNMDKSAYQLRIVEEGQEKKVELLPTEQATDLCKSQCDIYVGTDPDPYVLVAADEFIIHDGQLYTAEELARETETPKQ